MPMGDALLLHAGCPTVSQIHRALSCSQSWSWAKGGLAGLSEDKSPIFACDQLRIQSSYKRVVHSMLVVLGTTHVPFNSKPRSRLCFTGTQDFAEVSGGMEFCPWLFLRYRYITKSFCSRYRI